MRSARDHFRAHIPFVAAKRVARVWTVHLCEYLADLRSVTPRCPHGSAVFVVHRLAGQVGVAPRADETCGVTGVVREDDLQIDPFAVAPQLC